LRLLRIAQNAASRGARLTESLLAFARKQRLEPVVADINAIIVEMSEMLRGPIGASIEIKYALASELWPSLIDVAQMQAALLNIALNARDAMFAKGILFIETANIGAGSEDMPDEVAGLDCVVISIRDTGVGMAPNVVKHAFEPFFTTKGPGQGTGLGLSMVFGMVRQSGGSVRIRSTIGSGTTVQIFLPRAADIAPPRAGQTATADDNDDEAAQILVVDDDPDVRWITAESLRQAGHIVIDADSGAAALQILARGTSVDLVVMDVVMPGMSGPETMDVARRTRPRLKVLFVTGYADEQKGQMGGEPLIKKPFRQDALAEAVHSALHRVPQRGVGIGNVVPLRSSE
jgi:CheY-like chemotaxis protein